MDVIAEVDLSTCECLRMTVDFHHISGENTVSFSCVSSERGPQPMGIAFVNLPQCVRPAVIIKQGPDDVDVTMEYHCGPECKYGNGPYRWACGQVHGDNNLTKKPVGK